MKKITLFTILILSFSLFFYKANAKIWRVNNQSNFDNTSNFGENYGGTPGYPVFKEINEAVANANVMNGDTLYVEGSVTTYNRASISKRLVIIGTGYFLEENPKVSNNLQRSSIPSIEFNAGSEGSELLGMDVVNLFSSDGTVYINVNEITIKRCRLYRDIDFGSGLNTAYILQNFFLSSSDNAFNTSEFSSFIPPQDIIFENNIVQTKLIWTGRILLECNNNVFDGPPNELNLDFNTSSFQNNILRSAGITANINNGTNNNVEFNTVSNAALFENTPGIVVEPAMNNLFVQNSSTDGNYQLQAGATNNVIGKDGAERGAFGGVTVSKRYTLSGLAAIPVIYSVSTTGVSEPDNGLPVTIEARIIK